MADDNVIWEGRATCDAREVELPNGGTYLAVQPGTGEKIVDREKAIDFINGGMTRDEMLILDMIAAFYYMMGVIESCEKSHGVNLSGLMEWPCDVMERANDRITGRK